MSVVSHTAVSAHVALGSCAAAPCSGLFVTTRPLGRSARLKTDPNGSNCVTNPSALLLQYLPRQNPLLSRGYGRAALKRR